jgi:hypothetical protein
MNRDVRWNQCAHDDETTMTSPIFVICYAKACMVGTRDLADTSSADGC